IDTFQTAQDNLPEMLQTLLMYEKKPGQVQSSHGQELQLDFIFFYNVLDGDKFARHENKWVMVHNQKMLEYGQEYDGDQLDNILKTMSGIIQLSVNQKLLL
ncbi:9347_t:CDS:2, partial [Ambispora leptoticha]